MRTYFPRTYFDYLRQKQTDEQFTVNKILRNYVFSIVSSSGHNLIVSAEDN
jgi:hypothetical protein